MKFIIASNNKHKIAEINAKLALNKNHIFLPLDYLGDVPEIIENGKTFQENALIKARTIAAVCNYPVLADDSGLVINALNGEPGIHSARYENIKSDYKKNLRILEKMENIPFQDRKAYFFCCIAIVFPDNREIIADGKCDGFITSKIKGDKGFGYDPIFYLSEYNKTMAEITPELKNRISHRAKALDRALALLNNI